LKYLTVKTRQEQHSGTLGGASSAKEIDEQFPFLLYASSYWLEHLYHATL